MDIGTIYTLAFWTCLVTLAIGTLLGLIAIWLPDSFNNDLQTRLFMTDGILFGVSLAVAIITRLLR